MASMNGQPPSALGPMTAAVLALAVFAAPAAAREAVRPAPAQDAQQDEIAHTVQEGDTLEGLARAYLDAPRQWPLLQARNKVANPRRLQPGSVVWIPVRLQPREAATVEFAQGNVTAQAQGGAAPAPVAQGGRLDEGTVLHVGPEAFVAVKLADGTVVRVQAQSELQLRQLRRRGRAGSLQSVLEMRSGAVESSVPPNAEAFRRFELRTPQAVTSVRGTRFDVALDGEGHTTAAVLNGSVAVQSRKDMPAAVPGAVRYIAQVAQDADFTRVLRHGSFADGQLRWKALDDGRYYLSVRAVDDAGIPGLRAAQPLVVKTRPVPPLYQEPAPGAVVPRDTGALTCTQVPGVSWYRLQVAQDAQFARPVLDAQRQPECRVALAELPPGNYFWRAASLLALPDGQPDQGPFAPPQPFTLADRPTALSAQSLQAQDGDATVHLHWPGQAGQRFRLQLAAGTDPGFDKPVLDTVLDAPQWTATQLPPGEYLVRIQVLDPTGLQSDFSAPRQIRVGSGVRTGAGLPVSTSSGVPVGRP